VYDLNNSRPIFDYAIDGTAGTNSKNGKNSIRRSLNKEDAANGFIRLELPIRSETSKK
jgi:hypothetical protein